MGGSVFCHGFIGNKIHAEQQRKRRHYCRGTGLLVPMLGSRGSCFPMNGSLFFALPAGKRNPASGWTKSCSAGRNPLFVRTKSAGDARRRKSPQNFRSAGFVYPGSYLLSRDLSSDYHRRTDVSLPGSEWDRVGPSGYDHQVSGSFSFLCCSLLTLVIICACGFLWCFCWLPSSAAG